MATSRPPIFFDFDGVIVESLAIKNDAFRTIYRSYGEEIVERVLEHHNNYAGISRVEKIKYCHKEFLGIDLDDQQLNELGQRYCDLVETGVVGCEAVLGAMRFLDSEAPHRDMIVISGTPQDELRRITSARNLDGYFKGVYGSPRYKEDIIQTLLDAHGYAPSQTVFVGDGKTDYDAAMATGLLFIGRVAPQTESPFPPDTELVSDLNTLNEAVENVLSERGK